MIVQLRNSERNRFQEGELRGLGVEIGMFYEVGEILKNTYVLKDPKATLDKTRFEVINDSPIYS